MGYYLSKKNAKILLPYLKILEASQKSVTFQTSNPEFFRTQLRNAFNTSHIHLRDSYRLRVTPSSVICERVDLQINLEISNVVESPVTLYEIAQAIIENNVPIKYLNASILDEELSSLISLAESKSFILDYNTPILEISYG